jgi:hypothetical protein
MKNLIKITKKQFCLFILKYEKRHPADVLKIHDDISQILKYRKINRFLILKLNSSYQSMGITNIMLINMLKITN